MRAAQVGRHVDGPHRLSTRRQSAADVADVELLDEPHSAGRTDGGLAAARPRRRALLVAAVCAAVLGALLLWPQPDPAPPGTGAGVLAWPARGSLSEDEALLRAGTAAWREAAASGRVPAPGADVLPLYLGETGGDEVAVVLGSLAADGTVLVAVGRRAGARVALSAAAPLGSTPPALVLPAGTATRLLVAPPPDAPDLVVRRADGLWQRMEPRADGLTATVRGVGDGPLVLGVVQDAFGQRGLAQTYALDSAQVLPQPDPLQVTSPAWGRSSAVTSEEYDAAASVAPLVQPGTAVAVLASTGIPGFRAVIAEVRRPEAPAPGVLFVVSENGSVFTAPPPAVQDGLAVGVLPRRDGRTLVLVGSSPGVARVEVRTGSGRTVVGGAGGASAVLPAPAPRLLEVLGVRPDGQVVARVAVAPGASGGETGSVVAAVSSAGG